MVIILNKQEIIIDKLSDLVNIIVTLANELAKELIQQFIAHTEFKLIVKNEFDLVNLIEILPDVYAQEMVEKLLHHPEEFNRIIDNVFGLIHVVNKLPEFAQAIMDKFLTNTKQFERFIPDYESLIVILKDLPEPFAKKVLHQFSLIHQIIPLNHAAKFDPAHIELLLNYGEDPSIEDKKDQNALCVLRDRNIYDFDIAIALIKHGVDPDTKNSANKTLLHDVAYQGSSIVPEVLAFGANPMITNKYRENALDVMMRKKFFSLQDADYAIVLLQYGAISHVKNSNKENILHVLYRKYPNIKNTILSQGIDNDKITDTEHVFSTIDMFSLRLEIKLQSPRHQAHNVFLNLCLQLALGENKAGLMQTLLVLLPIELIPLIASFMGVDKSSEECQALILASLAQRATIKQMVGTPGGISVLQHNNKDGSFTFSFFNSAPSLCVAFNELKEKLKKTQDRSLWDKIRKRELTDESVATLNKFKETYASKYLHDHLSFYKRVPLKAALRRSVQDSALYWPQEKKTKIAHSRRLPEPYM